MYLIAGLGNPGSKYSRTRHNMGFAVAEAFARSLGIGLSAGRFRSRYGRALVAGRAVLIVCPMTFMNRSGEAVGAWVRYYRTDPGAVLVIHDDLDLPLGRVRVAKGGGAGGHKGVGSCIEHLRTKDFPRVRIGIGRPAEGEEVQEFVLSPFREDEEGVVTKVIELGIRACELFVGEGVDAAMNAVNGQNLISKQGG